MADVYRLTPEMIDAWAEWDDPFMPDPPLSRVQLPIARIAFLGGWIAATGAAERIALQWRDENRAARDRARMSGRVRNCFDGDETQLVMAEQLDGAAIECNAIAQAIRALASVDTHSESGDAKQAPCASMGSAVDAEGSETPQ